MWHKKKKKNAHLHLISFVSWDFENEEQQEPAARHWLMHGN